MKAGASSMWASCCGLLNEVMGTGTMRPPGGQAGFGAGARPFRFAPGAGYSTYPPATPSSPNTHTSSSSSSTPVSASANTGPACKACGLAFSVFRRKHMCSDCRKSFCALCSILQENLRRCTTCHLLWGTAFQRPQLMRLRVKDLRQYLTLRNIPTDTCREKEDLVELVLCTLGPRSSRIREEGEEEEEEELDGVEVREEEVVVVLGCEEEKEEEGEVKKKEGEERKEGEDQEDREDKQACEEKEEEVAAPEQREAPAEEEEQEVEVTGEEVDRGEEERPEMLLTPPQGSAPRSVSENSELSITASQDDTLSSSDSTGTSSQDQADAASLSILNLDDSSSIQEASPGSQRRARASLSDITSEGAIESLTVRQLKEILARNFVNFSGCCEKWELVERVHRLYHESEQNRRSMENMNTDITTVTTYPPPICLGDVGDGVVKPQLSTADENLCRICMDAFIDCVLLECGHMVTCTKCGKRMNECPICRQYVVRAVHVFKS